LALGYEDLNDHEQLRQDPLLQRMAGKAEPGSEPLAGKSTLNRMELGSGMPDRDKKINFWRDSVDDLLVEVFLEAHPAAPEPESPRRMIRTSGQRRRICSTIRATSFLLPTAGPMLLGRRRAHST